MLQKKDLAARKNIVAVRKIVATILRKHFSRRQNSYLWEQPGTKMHLFLTSRKSFKGLRISSLRNDN